MMAIKTWTVVILVLCAAKLSRQNSIKQLHRDKRQASGSSVATCTAEYANIIDHTMCKEDDPRVTTTGVSAADRQTILDIHNSNRSTVSPAATNLAPLVWSDKIAEVAQKMAQSCPDDHDKVRWVPSLGLTVGQNLASGQANWAQAVLAWSAEEADYTYGMDLSDPTQFGKVGHYTQMVQSNAFLIGCGYAYCANSQYSRYYVCNYASAQSDPERPYTDGTRCSDCTKSCSNGLCDCNGLVCLNGGTLDINGCTCQCHSMYTGNDCGQLDCTQGSEPSRCSKIDTADCQEPYNFTACPITCGRCPARQAFVSVSGCTYTGHRYSAAECDGFGDYGFDSQHCASRNGKYDCASCTAYANVPKEYCPVQCGLCEPREPFVSAAGCKFYGGRATAAQCATHGNKGQDYPFCSSFTCEDCIKYSNVPTDYCPMKCGLCG
ncbi:hypothetical protein ACOMHN_033761 [Nucella lapillus]